MECGEVSTMQRRSRAREDIDSRECDPIISSEMRQYV